MNIYDKIKYFIRRLKLLFLAVLVMLLIAVWSNHFWQLGSTNFQSQQNSQTIKKQRQIKNELHRYLKKVGQDKTATVSFYNLTPLNDSDAAKRSDAAVYQAGKLAVGVNEHQTHVSASTYKLFISAYLFQQHKLGDFSWTDANQDGFKRMIVNSENDFAENQLRKYGLKSINQFIAQQGLYSPVFTDKKSATTTAYSLQMLLESLYYGNGPFTNQADRRKLLGYMRQQVYRTGIPAGAKKAMPGAVVADKVGFLGSVNNDAAIVTLPNGQRYILVIMTHGHHQSGFSGFERIAQMTTKIQTIVYK